MMFLFSQSLAIAALFGLSLATPTQGANPSAEQILITTMLRDYNRNARPVSDRRRSTNVTFGLEIVQLVNVDDRNQMITTNVWVRQRWTNELLTWNANDYKGVHQIRIDPQLVWIPDIVLYNRPFENDFDKLMLVFYSGPPVAFETALSQNAHYRFYRYTLTYFTKLDKQLSADSIFSGGLEKYKTRVIINNKGYSAWFSPASFRSTCKIDVTFFPFDEQTCTMKFGSWTFVVTDLDIDIERSPTFSDKYVKSAEWDLIRASKKRSVQFYECCSIPFADVTIEIVIRRKSLFYAFNLITPCMIMLSMILLGFFLPPESGERITLSITVLLAMAVFLQLVAETLPRNSETIPLLGKFYITIMAEISMSLMATCWVLNIHHRNSGRSIVKIPDWVEVYLLGWLSTILCVRKPSLRPDGDVNKHQNRNGSFGGGELIQLKISSHAQKNKTCVNGDRNALLPVTGTPVCRSLPQVQKRLAQHNATSANPKENEKKNEDSFTKNLNLLAEHTRMSSKIEDNQKKWKHVAMVMDRFFFWLFIVTVLISTLAIFKEKIRQQQEGASMPS